MREIKFAEYFIGELKNLITAKSDALASNTFRKTISMSAEVIKETFVELVLTSNLTLIRGITQLMN